MSEQETVTAKLVKLTDSECLFYYGDMLSMDEDEKWEYRYENGLFWLDGNLWQVKEKKEYDYSDFVNVSKKTDTELEFTASWYNGGCSFTEIVEEAFKKGAKS
jgi:hypothetical protein